MNERLRTLADAGVSIWLDDLSRERITSGTLAALINEKSVTGVTTNPTIFAAALSQGDAYAAQVRELAGEAVPAVVTALTTTDVADACDVFMPVYEATSGVDGRVSIEVDPGLARDTDATIAQAADLAARVGKPNVLIKIPATREGLAAITATIAAGISVNVTLIFSKERYLEVIDAYLTGLEQAQAARRDLAIIHSVASFFVRRADSEADRRLEAIGTAEALPLRGKTGIANARVAYGAFTDEFSAQRWNALSAAGANLQRPLWASTGVKNPAYPDTMYVSELVAPDTVNTMPEKTMDAFADHGEVGLSIADAEVVRAAQDVLDRVRAVGVDLDDVFDQLEREGVDKFVASWDELVTSVTQAVNTAR